MYVSIDSLNKSYRYIIFIRSSKNETYSTDKSLYSFYNNEIFYPFVNGMRKLKYSDWNQDSKPTQKILIVIWYDRDIGRVNNISSNKTAKKDIANKIIRNKHSPKRSSTEAACNLRNSFKSMKTTTKILMMKNDSDTIMS